jgi:hypothetical protein
MTTHDHKGSEGDSHREHHFKTARSGNTTLDVGDSNAIVTLRGDDNVVTGGSGDVSVIGPKSAGDQVTLGDGDDRVSLHGDDSAVSLGGGSDRLWLFGDSNTATLGDGNDRLWLHGQDNSLTLGSGDNTVRLGPKSSHNTISVGSGTDTITTTEHDHDNTFSLDASTTSLLLNGSGNLVFINGGTDTITDTHFPPGQGDDLFLQIGSLGGEVNITNFSTALGTVDLAPGLGFSTAAAIAAAVTSDGHGGSLLTFGSSLGSIDFVGVAVGSLTASNFKIG